jgi:tetratricopeptide (TPR) repeat protein
MGGEPIRPRQHIYFCLALLMFFSACSLVDDLERQRQLLDGLALLQQGDFDGSLKAFETVAAIAQDQPPADAANYHMGLVYAHWQNPKRDRPKAMGAFSRVISRFPDSPWAGQAKIWIGVLREAEESKQEIERSKQLIEKTRQEAERSQQEAERSRQEAERSRQAAEKSKQEIERTNQILEKSRQVDIEIEQKRRERVK